MKERFPYGAVLRLEHDIQKGGDVPIDILRDVPATIDILQRGVGGKVTLIAKDMNGDPFGDEQSGELRNFDVTGWLSHGELRAAIRDAMTGDLDDQNPMSRRENETDEEHLRRLLELLVGLSDD